MKLRGPLFKGTKAPIGQTFYVRELRGQLIACKWPRKRPRPTHPTTLEQMEKFRQANWAAKYTHADIQIAYRQMVAGTQNYPRDLLIAAMYGRGFTWQIDGMRRLYPVAAIRDLSDTLDIFGSLNASVLVRGPLRWEAVPAATAGYVLTSQGSSDAPAWLPSGALGFGWRNIADDTLSANLSTNVYHDVAITGNAQEIEWSIYWPANATGVFPRMRVNGETDANYTDGQIGRWAASSTINDRVTAQTSWRLFNTAWSPGTADGWARGRIAKPASGGSTFAQAEVSYEAYRITATLKKPNFDSNPISLLSFCSSTGVGLRTGTRIIVRACYQ